MNKDSLRRQVISFIPLFLSLLTVLVSTCCLRPLELLPINDEWSLGYPVQTFIQSGHFVFSTVTSFALTQLVLSLPICAVFGSTYPGLRIVVVLFGLLACFSMYLLGRELGLKRWGAGLFSMCVSCNPFFICLTNAAMSDVPFCALSLLTFAFIARACKQDRKALWIISGLFLCLTLAERQSALMYIPGVMCLLAYRFWNRRTLLVPGISLAVMPVVAYAILEPVVKGLTLYPGPASGYKAALVIAVLKIVTQPVSSLWPLWQSAVFCLCYLGLMCLPLLIPMGIGTLQKEKLAPVARNCTIAFIVISIPLLSVVCFQNIIMPFSNNLFDPPYMGTYILCGNRPMSVEWCKVVTALCSILAFSLVCGLLLSAQRFWHISRTLRLGLVQRKRISENFQPDAREFHVQFSCFLLGAFVTFFIFTIVQTTVQNLDRYYVSLWPLCLAVLCTVFSQVCTRKISMLVIPLAVAYAVFGTVEGVDCHNFNRTRERCIKYLENRGVSPKEIDGGQEYNFISNAGLLGCYKYFPENPKLSGFDQSLKGTEQTRALRWWPITGERFIISRDSIPGYKTVYAAHYFSPLLARKVNLSALERL